jgi:hypothetical protein
MHYRVPPGDPRSSRCDKGRDGIRGFWFFVENQMARAREYLNLGVGQRLPPEIGSVPPTPTMLGRRSLTASSFPPDRFRPSGLFPSTQTDQHSRPRAFIRACQS